MKFFTLVDVAGPVTGGANVDATTSPRHSSEILAARLFFRAAFPVMRVLLADDPRTSRAFASVVAKVRFSYLEASSSPGGKRAETGITLVFDRGSLDISEELLPEPDIALRFPTVEAMNSLLRGGLALPSIKGLGRPGLLVKVLGLLMGLKLMAPTAKPSDPIKRRLKVKLSLYMITTALSQYNKAGVPSMRSWTAGQPDRIYQFSVEPVDETGIAAWFRVKGGNSKAGRGEYARRSPFVHFRFNGVDGALAILGKELGFVEGVEKGMVRVDGSPEYAAALNDHMALLQDMLT